LLALIGKPGQKSTQPEISVLRVGSQYPSLAPRLLSEIGFRERVLPIHGTAEAWINIGAIDAAVDTWRTGATADANELDLLQVFRETSFVIASLSSETYFFDTRILDFVRKFELWLRG
jgi:ATP phosphoribosyltransferase